MLGSRLTIKNAAGFLLVSLACSNACAGITFSIHDREGNFYQAGDITDTNATAWVQETQIDSDFVDITVSSTEPVTSYQVNYGSYASQPTYSIAGTIASVFLGDYHLFRSDEDQWIRLIVTTAGGSEELRLGLKDDVSTSPPDDPILPFDYVADMGQGHNWKHSWNDTDKDSQQEMDKWAVGLKRNGMNHIRYKTNMFEYFLDPANRPTIDMQIDTLLRHGLKVVWTKNDPEETFSTIDEFITLYSNFWEQVAAELKYKTHNLSFEFFQEMPSSDPWVGNGAVNGHANYNALLDACTTAIRNNTLTRIVVYSSNLRSHPEALEHLNVPYADTGIYYFGEWHNWAGGPAKAENADRDWTGSGTISQKAAILEQFDYARAWATSNGVPMWFGAIWENNNNYGNNVHVPERVSFLEFILDQAGQDGTPVCYLGYKYDVATDSFHEFELPVMEAKNGTNTWNLADRDGDGISNDDEVTIHLTDPDDCDTDNDNIVDGMELKHGLDPLNRRDGNPVLIDSYVDGDLDGDGMGNAWEILSSYDYKDEVENEDYPFQDPRDPLDGEENLDNDGLKSYWEALIWFTPCCKKSTKAGLDDVVDIDDDGVGNLDEYLAGTWPGDKSDHDQDGFIGTNDVIPYVSDDAHVVRYIFDDVAGSSIPDTSNRGNDNTGTLQGGAAVVGGALSLDGSGDNVVIPDTTDINTEAASDHTILLQFKADSTTPDYQILYEQGNQTDGISIYLNQPEVWAGVYSGGKSTFLKLGIATVGRWHTVAVGFDGIRQRVRGSFDRRFVGELPIALSALPPQSGDITIGGNISGGSNLFHTGSVLANRNFDGLIDEFQVYNRQLSEVDVARLSVEVADPFAARAPFFLNDPVPAENAEPEESYNASLKDVVFDYNLTDTLTFTLPSGGPSWLNVASNGTMSGTPLMADMGTNSFTVRVEDSTALYDEALVTILVATNPPVVIFNTNTFAVVEDTYIHKNKSTENFGSDEDLMLRSQVSGFARVSLLKFNVVGVTGTVESAKLRIYSESQDTPVDVRRIASSWGEFTVTWDNAPAFGAFINSGSPSLNSWFEVDVADYVVSNGTYSFMIEEFSNSAGKMNSREHSNGNIPELVIISRPPVVSTPYETWSSDYGLSGTNALLTANPDNDELNNLGEYALGGNPINGPDAVSPEMELVTDALQYTYRRRTDAAARGLSYYLELTDDLVYGAWTNDGYTVVDTAPAETGFETVTNHISTVVKTNQFIRLKVEISE